MTWTWRWECAVLLLVGALFATGPAVADGVDWEAFFAGEVVVEAVQHPDGIPGVRALFTVAASRERIWAALVDYTNFAQVFQGIDKMRVLAQDQRGAQVEYWVNAVLAKYHYVLYRRYDEPGRRLTWTRIAGDLKRIEGGWEIRDTPRPDSYLLVYESYVDIGGVIPTSLMRFEVMRRTRAMSERFRNWIEGHPMPDEGTSQAREP